jgi:hypothetical protein
MVVRAIGTVVPATRSSGISIAGKSKAPQTVRLIVNWDCSSACSLSRWRIPLRRSCKPHISFGSRKGNVRGSSSMKIFCGTWCARHPRESRHAHLRTQNPLGIQPLQHRQRGRSKSGRRATFGVLFRANGHDFGHSRSAAGGFNGKGSEGSSGSIGWKTGAGNGI